MKDPLTPGLPAVSDWSSRVGVVGLYLFAGSAFFATAAAYLGLALMLLAAVGQWSRLWPALRGDPLAWLFAWTVLAVLLSNGLATWARSHEAVAQIDSGLALLRLWWFVLIAWSLQGSQDRLLIVLGLTLVGYLLGTLKTLDADSLNALVALERPSFRWSINAFAEYTGAALLGLVVMAPRLQRALRGKRWHWPVILAFGALIVVLLIGVLLSQSRGVWLSLALVVVLLLAYQLAARPERRPSRGLMLAVAALLSAALAASLILNSDVMGRVSFLYQPLVERSASPDLATPSDASISERTQILRLATESWLQKPWVGWGLGSAPFLIQAHGDRFLDADNYNDFHNLVMDLLVGLGLFGTLPILLVVLLVLRSLWLSWRRGLLDWDVYLLLLGLLLFNLMSQLTDTRILSLHGRFFWLVTAGAAYAFDLAYGARSASVRKRASHA
jgi:O-antigen ligase